ncbi:hypothetical protein [uncultured Robinsoniella sp.]|uniref:hypothetical protein n=1 Tax=uncultured Robinsoniella sp. TaxID=904190 RepID=UPI00374FD568
MHDIKQSFQIAGYNFHLWKKNPRVIMTFALAFVLCLMLSDKAVSLAKSYGTNMQILEAFVWTFGDANSIMISSLLLILLFADMPFISQATPYFLCRTKRSLWVWGQVIYVVLATVIYTSFLLAVSCIICAPLSFPGNMWSETGALLGYSGVGVKIALPATVKTMEMSYPYQCAAVIFLLITLYSLMIASVMLLFNLCKSQFMGVLSVFALNLYGLLLNPQIFMTLFRLPLTMEYKANIAVGWLSPLNHATYYMHNFGYDNLPRIWMSAGVFVGIITMNLLFVSKIVRKYEFHFQQLNE